MRVASLEQLHLFRRGHKPAPVRAAPEFRFSCAFADLLRRSASSEWWWMHYPAGEERTAKVDAEGRRFSPAGARLKRMGLKTGVADYLFISPIGRTYALELKRRDGGDLSGDQEKFRDWCRAHNVPWRVARSFDQALEIVTAWGVLKHKVEPQ